MKSLWYDVELVAYVHSSSLGGRARMLHPEAKRLTSFASLHLLPTDNMENSKQGSSA